MKIRLDFIADFSSVFFLLKIIFLFNIEVKIVMF